MIKGQQDPFKFPVLWDATEYLVYPDGTRKKLRYAKGFFDYDDSIFIIPTNKLKIIIEHFKEDFEIILNVGLKEI